ncbi:sensor histidine kinase [Ramlibacter albus]|uniref:histidine kinase n=1 Tax=Ramlibacter albus TaxID=2079448 RepID=A0A923MCR8_9BURK|nr:HAMP domain-containing sensor histidine kinase [Ramlibacter albus]MBC5767004.1 HAMP domain-containing histidine kinase [Ramlibacter albus]
MAQGGPPGPERLYELAPCGLLVADEKGLRPAKGDRLLVHVAVFVAEDRHKYESELLVQRQRAEQLLAQHEEDQRQLAAARRQAEERAVFAEQMMGIVSHDLRNPLGTIRMSAAVLGMMPLADAQRDALRRIERGTLRAERLLADLLDVTQARLGHGLRMRKTRVDLHEVVAEAVSDWASAFGEHTLKHERNGVGEWDADPERVVQAIGNLVRNAANYGDPTVPITVSSEVLAGSFRVTVHNGGEPIAPDALPYLFEPMVRGPESDQQGLGLGLYIVREIARAHGGRVEAASSAADGTTFTIELGT